MSNKKIATLFVITLVFLLAFLYLLETANFNGIDLKLRGK